MHVGNIHNQLGSCFGLIVPGHLLELVGSGVPLRMVPNVSKIFEDCRPVRVLPAISYLLDCPVMRFGPTFAFPQGCPTKCDHGLPPRSVRFLFQRISTAFIVEAPDEVWEPCESRVGSSGVGSVDMFAASRSRLDYTDKVSCFHKDEFYKIHCKLDSTEYACLLKPTQPCFFNWFLVFGLLFRRTASPRIMVALESWYTSNAHRWCAAKFSSTVPRGLFFVFFWLCRHTASPPITSEMHIGGVQ